VAELPLLLPLRRLPKNNKRRRKPRRKLLHHPPRRRKRRWIWEICSADAIALFKSPHHSIS